MTPQEPLCTGTNCHRKYSCGHYSDIIHEDDIAFTHAPVKPDGRCSFYLGIDDNALREYIKGLIKPSNGENK